MQRIFQPLKAKGFPLWAMVFLLLAGLTLGCAADKPGLAGGSAGTQGAYQLPPLAPLPSAQPTPYPLPALVPIPSAGPTPGWSISIATLSPVTPTPSPKLTPSSTPANADWVLSVDSNATYALEGFTYYSNLYVSMNKVGGRDVKGAYSGKILYAYTADEGDVKREIESTLEHTTVTEVHNSTTIEAVSADIEVIPYNAKAFGALWGSAPAKADYMAMATIDMKMRVDTDIKTYQYFQGEGSGGGSDESITMPVEIAFLITGGQVKAYIGVHPEEKPFSGILIGTLR